MRKRWLRMLKRGFTLGMSLQMLSAVLLVTLPATMVSSGLANVTFEDEFSMTKLASFQAAAPSADGGVAEIVAFNKDNSKFYVVNGAANPPTLDIVPLGTSGDLTKDASVNIKTLVETNGFLFGDLTSVDVNTVIDRVFVAVQASGAADAGKIVELDYAGNLIAEFSAGAQPDMIVSTPNGRYVLTANEGEPRVAGTDPQGSITILNTETDTVQHLLFDNPDVIDDQVHIRGVSSSAVSSGQITSKGMKADAIFDLEPEYITISADSKQAYISLQENNAIATVSLETMTITSVKGLGLKDHSLTQNSLDVTRNNAINLENVPFFGVYNPDGISNMTVDGKRYILSANEGDATDFSGRKNAISISNFKNTLNVNSVAGQFLSGKTAYNQLEVASDWGTEGVYMYGARSFSIWDASSMNQVYDSANEFERITAQRLPNNFNANHSATAIDNRSARKGPEPEGIEVGSIGYRTFAFISLERIGGVMVYDVTNPSKAKFVNYTNTRLFTPTNTLATETGPEGLDFIPGSSSPTGKPLLLIANEVSGNVTVMQVNLSDENPDTIHPTKPGAPSITNVSAGQVRIAWKPSTDNFMLEGYRVFVNGQQLTTVKSPAAVIKNLAPSTSYTVTIKAFDKERNLSTESDALTFQTAVNPAQLVDSEAPAAPQNLVSTNVNQFSFRLDWSAATDNVGVKEYEVYQNGVKVATVPTTAHRLQGLVPGRTYNVNVIAVDQQGNKSVASSALAVTTAPATTEPDTQAPQSPTSLVQSNVTSSGFKVSWTPSTDNVFTLGYNVYLNGQYVATVGQSSYTFSNLTTAQNYTVRVLAFDLAKNRSSLSTPLIVSLNP